MASFTLGFNTGRPIEIEELRDARPPTPKPCIDERRVWLGCNPARQACCPFFEHGEKLPGCTLYSPMRYTPTYRPGKHADKPDIDPAELDGFSIEEAG